MEGSDGEGEEVRVVRGSGGKGIDGRGGSEK